MHGPQPVRAESTGSPPEIVETLTRSVWKWRPSRGERSEHAARRGRPGRGNRGRDGRAERGRAWRQIPGSETGRGRKQAMIARDGPRRGGRMRVSATPRRCGRERMREWPRARLPVRRGGPEARIDAGMAEPGRSEHAARRGRPGRGNRGRDGRAERGRAWRQIPGSGTDRGRTQAMIARGGPQRGRVPQEPPRRRPEAAWQRAAPSAGRSGPLGAEVTGRTWRRECRGDGPCRRGFR